MVQPKVLHLASLSLGKQHLSVNPEATEEFVVLKKNELDLPAAKSRSVLIFIIYSFYTLGPFLLVKAPLVNYQKY